LAIRAMLSYLKHCQACGERFDSSDRMKRACIDHDHETGYFRGIICGNCNITEGRMNATSFRKLADYLDRTTPSNEMSGYIQTATE